MWTASVVCGQNNATTAVSPDRYPEIVNVLDPHCRLRSRHLFRTQRKGVRYLCARSEDQQAFSGGLRKRHSETGTAQG